MSLICAILASRKEPGGYLERLNSPVGWWAGEFLFACGGNGRMSGAACLRRCVGIASVVESARDDDDFFFSDLVHQAVFVRDTPWS